MSSEERSASIGQRRHPVLLTVSLCLNVALIGMIVAALVVAARLTHVSHRRSLSAIVDVASPPEQSRIAGIIQAHARKLCDLREASRSARMDGLHLFEAPALDRAAFLRSIDKVRDADAALRDEETAMFVEAATLLSPQERETLARQTRERRLFGWYRFFRLHSD